MQWSVRFLDTARRQYLDLPDPIRLQVDRKIGLLEEHPFPVCSKKFRHRDDLYRLRVGDYRVLYHVDRSECTVRIVRVRMSTPV